MTAPKTVLLVADNLLIAPKVAALLKAAGWTVQTRSRPEAEMKLDGFAPSAALLDLSIRGLDISAGVKALRSALPPGTPIVGFCGHLEREKQETARAAGCALVVPNSAAVQDPGAVLERLLPSY